MNDKAQVNGAVGTLPEATAKTQTQWREHCAELMAEIEQLRGEVEMLRDQSRTFAQMIPVPDHIKALENMTAEEVLATATFEPSFRQLVERVENAGGH